MRPEVVNALTSCGVATFSVLATLGVQAFVRHWTAPRLRVEFREDDECFLLRTQEVGRQGFPRSDARFLRVRISNTGRRTAKKCRVHLVNWERRHQDRWAPTAPRYCDSIPLKWSYESDDVALAGIDISPGTWRFADVLSASAPEVPPEDPLKFRFQTPSFPTYCEDLLDRTDRFRLTIQASGEDVEARRIRIEFRWKGNWRSFEAKFLDVDGPCAIAANEGCEPTASMYWKCLRGRWEWLRDWLKKLP